MKRLVRATCLLLVVLLTLLVGGSITPLTPVSAANPVWSEVVEARIPNTGLRQIVPVTYRTVQLDMTALRAELANAPRELTAEAKNTPLTIELPQPDGTMGRFHVEEYSMMEPKLAAQFPDWRTYHAQGVDDPTAVARISITAQGFHGMVLGGTKGTYYIDPYQQGDTTNYISYFKSDFRNPRGDVASEEVIIDERAQTWLDSLTEAELAPTNGVLRTYRLANAATGEYCTFHGGTVALCQAAIVTAINRVNGVYEREVNIRMILVANNTSVVYTNGATDPYSNNNGSAMLSQNQTTLDNVIGNANYDIGHVFSTGGGGVAFLGVPCVTGSKAGGVTGQSAPVNDPFYIDYVAHEMGHQWGADHTFNGTTSSCSGNRTGSSAYEPGSGITIMGYAGICGTENIAKNSIDTFVSRSYDQIRAYITTGSGESCDVPINTGNDAPVVNAGADYTIPARTPFELEGTATDSTPGSLTYDWQQYNIGSSTNSGNTNTDLGNNPIFRPWLPETDGLRIFPDLTYILNNANVPPNPTSCPIIPGQPAPSGTCSPGMTLPTTNRTLVFRLTARDNVANAGGVNYDAMNAVVVNTAGPFQVTSNNTAGGSYPGGSTQTVTWNVANTSAAPVSCANVNVLVSTDGGNTFPNTAGANLPNTGSGSVTVPNVTTTTARWKIKCANNIFFDINDANFSITAGGPTSTPTATNTPGAPTNTPTATNTPVAPTNTPTATTTPTGSGLCASPNLPITDNLPAGVTSTINVAQTGTISDLNVQLDVTHSWVGDLIFTLSHNATTAELYDRPGFPTSTFGCSGDNFNATADDEGATSFEAACGTGTPAFPVGNYIPGDPAGPNLAAFDGQDISGAWTLTASDNAQGDTGRLNSWCLEPTLAGPTNTPTATVTNTPAPTNTATATNTVTPIPPTNTPTVTSTPTQATITPVPPTNTPTVPASEPDIQVTPTALTETHPNAPQVTTDTVTIANIGTSTLTWSITESAPAALEGVCTPPSDIAWLSVSPTSGSTAGGSSSAVTVTYNSTGLADGTYTGTLCITTNDPDESLVTIPVTLAVNVPTAVTLGSFGNNGSHGAIVEFATVGILLLAGAVFVMRRK